MSSRQALRRRQVPLRHRAKDDREQLSERRFEPSSALSGGLEHRVALLVEPHAADARRAAIELSLGIASGSSGSPLFASVSARSDSRIEAASLHVGTAQPVAVGEPLPSSHAASRVGRGDLVEALLDVMRVQELAHQLEVARRCCLACPSSTSSFLKK